MKYSPPSRRKRVVARLLVPLLIATATALASPLSAAATTNPAADDFERANGPLGSSWTSDRGTWSIASGAALATSATGNSVATYNQLPIGLSESFRTPWWTSDHKIVLIARSKEKSDA